MENKSTVKENLVHEFKNKSLEKSVAKATEAFDSYSEAIAGLGDEIDNVSDDIRALEAFFQEKGFAVPYTYEYNDSENGSFDALEWGSDNKSKKFRLNRVVYQAGEVKSRKPLIEEQLLIRIEASAMLPKFVKGFAKKVKKISKNLKEFGTPEEAESSDITISTKEVEVDVALVGQS